MMISVRLVGRGGQGIKSATHIVGTAAFLGGRYVQDQPLYGAERRGAPITAFMRISDQPVMDRGPVAEPALLVLADESLLDESQSINILEGVSADNTAAVLVNSSKSADYLASRYGISCCRLVVADLARMAEEELDRPVVSSAVAGATSRLLGQDFKNLQSALALEFRAIRAGGEEELARNLNLAKRAYDSLEPLKWEEMMAQQLPRGQGSKGQRFVELRYHGPLASTCSIVAPGNTKERRVGAWSHIKPVIDYDTCTKCRICFVYCPDSAISIGSDDSPIIDYGACKGCNICYTECPVKAISPVRREEGV
jgi:pyruvate ferredoxin oxidoreductase gamma subunit